MRLPENDKDRPRDPRFTDRDKKFAMRGRGAVHKSCRRRTRGCRPSGSCREFGRCRVLTLAAHAAGKYKPVKSSHGWRSSSLGRGRRRGHPSGAQRGWGWGAAWCISVERTYVLVRACEGRCGVFQLPLQKRFWHFSNEVFFFLGAFSPDL